MAAEDQYTNQFRVELNGAALADEVASELTSVLVDSNSNLPDLFVLTFRDQGRELLGRGGFEIGARVVIKVFSDDYVGGERLVTGEVTALEMEVHPQGTFTVLRGYDLSHRLHRRRVTTAHIDVTSADIAQQIAKTADIPVGTVEPTSPSHPRLGQLNETDWAFLQRLAAEVGFEACVLDGEFHFRRAPAARTGPAPGTTASADPLQLSLGVNLLRCNAVVNAAEQVEEVEVRGWNPRSKQAVVARRPATTTSAQIGANPKDLAAKFASRRRVSVDVPYSTQEEVDAAARALAEGVASCFAELEGVARGTPRLRAGTAISLGLAKAPFDGRYTLSSARHTWVADEGYLVAFAATAGRDRSLHGLVAGSGSASAPATDGLPGVTVATVCDVSDPEELQRVRLSFPWMDERYESDWARTAQAGAGPERGWHVVPEVGDEVLVAFQHGDLRRPVVIGGLYNGEDRPSSAAVDDVVDRTTGEVNRRSYTSRTGQRLVFVDKEGKEAIEVCTGDDKHSIVLDRAGAVVQVTTDGEVRIEARGTVLVASESDVRVEARGDMKLQATGELGLSARKVTVTASTGLEMDGGPTTTLKGGVVQIN